MQKYIYSVLLASLAVMSMTLSSCSDNDDDEGSSVVAVSQILKFILVSDSTVSVSGFNSNIDENSVTSVDIPSQVTIDGKTYAVTSIAMRAFLDCSNLTTVTIPNSVTSIGYDAFKNCCSLANVTISENVTKIGEEAFKGCTQATVVVACDLESIGKNAFSDVHTLTISGKASSLLESGKIGFYPYVDLGLPSGLKWATFNVGASSIVQYGVYYCWGGTYELKAPDGFSFVTDETLIAANDAATVNWGNSWRMPSVTEMQELIDGCDWQWIDNFYGTVEGKLGTSKTNGKQIFLPASGKYDWDDMEINESGFYWTSSLYEKEFNGYYVVSTLKFDQNSQTIEGGVHANGYTVRPVSK